MEKIRLFNKENPRYENDSYEVREDYANFIDEIYNNRPITSYPELEKYRKNINLLLNAFSIDSVDIMKDGFWRKYIDLAVCLSKELDTTKINKKLLDNLVNSSVCSIEADHLITLLEVIYLPHEVSEFRYYLYNCLYIVEWYLNDSNIEEDAEDFLKNLGNKELSKFFKYLNSLLDYIDYDELYDESYIIALIFAYLHYHKIDNYDLVGYYFNNINYFKDKLYFNDCFPYNIEKSYMRFYDYEKARLLFDNMDTFFSREKGSIK